MNKDEICHVGVIHFIRWDMSWFWTVEIACCYVAANGGQCVWYLGLSWSPGCSCWLWGQRPEWPPTTKLAFVHNHLAESTGNSESFSAPPNLLWPVYQVWSLSRLVRTHSQKHWCFGDLTDSTLADDDAKIKSFEDSSFKASLAFAFLQFSDRARGYPPIPLRKNSATKQV